MSSFKQIQILKQPKQSQTLTDAVLYWKDYQFPTVINEYGGINCIKVTSQKPYYIAATHASRVHIYENESKRVLKSFNFSENAYSASFRDDGKMMCIGFESNNCKVYPLLNDQKQDQDLIDEMDEANENKMSNGGDGQSSNVPKKRALRTFDDHLGPVHVSKFMRNLYQVMTASDDSYVRLFDLATSQTLMKLKAHKDYIRSGCASKSSDDLILTGSYDHTAKLIDTRTRSVVLSVDHGEPVEDVLLFPSSQLIVTCGGNAIKVWDVLKGGNLMKTMINHHKTVTCMSFSYNHKYLLSGGLDRHVKIYDVQTYDLVHTIDYPSPILSLSVLNADQSLMVGMSDGLLSIRDKKTVVNKTFNAKNSKYNPYKYVSPLLVANSPVDHVVTHLTKQHLRKYDKYLKKFNSTKALDSALEHKVRIKTPQVTIGVMQELIRRGTIRAALTGKSEKSLGNLIKFIQRNISNPNFTATLTDISNILLDLYMNDIGKYAAIDDLFVRLKQTIDIEIQYQTSLFQVIGTLETIFNTNNVQ